MIMIYFSFLSVLFKILKKGNISLHYRIYSRSAIASKSKTNLFQDLNSENIQFSTGYFILRKERMEYVSLIGHMTHMKYIIVNIIL